LGEDDFPHLASAMQLTRQSTKFLLTAWVFLPDHWHALIFPKHPLTISRVMKEIKVRSTHEINLLRREAGELWQARFFDHALRTVQDYHDCLTYIHFNPVKRGLSRKPEEWKWSSIHSYSSPSQSLLAVDTVNLPADLNAQLL
jgi:putative transposase